MSQSKSESNPWTTILAVVMIYVGLYWFLTGISKAALVGGARKHLVPILVILLEVAVTVLIYDRHTHRRLGNFDHPDLHYAIYAMLAAYGVLLVSCWVTYYRDEARWRRLLDS